MIMITDGHVRTEKNKGRSTQAANRPHKSTFQFCKPRNCVLMKARHHFRGISSLKNCFPVYQREGMVYKGYLHRRHLSLQFTPIFIELVLPLLPQIAGIRGSIWYSVHVQLVHFRLVIFHDPSTKVLNYEIASYPTVWPCALLSPVRNGSLKLESDKESA